MNCYQCGKPGCKLKTFFSCGGKNRWMKFACYNKACVFEYESFERGIRKARPTWAIPLKEVK